MSSKNIRLGVALVAVAVAVAGLATAGPAAADEPRTTARTVMVRQTPNTPVDFADLATSPLPAGAGSHLVTVTNRNDSTAPLTSPRSSWSNPRPRAPSSTPRT